MFVYFLISRPQNFCHNCKLFPNPSHFHKFRRPPNGFCPFGERGSVPEYNEGRGRECHFKVPRRCTTSRHNIRMVQKRKFTIEFRDNDGNKGKFLAISFFGAAVLKAFESLLPSSANSFIQKFVNNALSGRAKNPSQKFLVNS